MIEYGQSQSMSIPTRRENTGWWKTRLEKRIDSGAELRGRERATFQSLADLTSWADEIRKWNSHTAATITSIYADSPRATAAQFASEVCPPISDVNFEKLSWSEVRVSLQTVIDSRTSAVANLIQRTR